MATWEPHGGVDVHIVYLALGPAKPWSMHETDVGSLAPLICPKHNAKIFALSLEILQVSPGSPPLQSLQESACEIIKALPLRVPFFLVDDSQGIATTLLWPLCSQLAGAAVKTISPVQLMQCM